MFKAPYFSKDELRTRAEDFLRTDCPRLQIPVPLEHILEFEKGSQFSGSERARSSVAGRNETALLWGG